MTKNKQTNKENPLLAMMIQWKSCLWQEEQSTRTWPAAGTSLTQPHVVPEAVKDQWTDREHSKTLTTLFLLQHSHLNKSPTVHLQAFQGIKPACAEIRRLFMLAYNGLVLLLSGENGSLRLFSKGSLLSCIECTCLYRSFLLFYKGEERTGFYNKWGFTIFCPVDWFPNGP